MARRWSCRRPPRRATRRMPRAACSAPRRTTTSAACSCPTRWRRRPTRFSPWRRSASAPGMLTMGNANLLMKHGTDLQKQVFALNEFSGRWSGTMCLSEPQAGSQLSDVVTRAVPDGADFANDPLGPRYRLKGNKMWISAGEHELTENIIHLVLAKIPDENGKLVPGTRGISLFIVPKKLVNTEGELTGERNDVALAGLNHKCGWRGTTNTLAQLRRRQVPGRGGAGRRRGLPGRPARQGPGLHVPHDERGAHRRRPGRHHAGHGGLPRLAGLRQEPARRAGPWARPARTPAQPQIRIIEHADVKRMLLAQKSVLRRRAGAGAVLRAAGRRAAHRRRPRRPTTRACCWRC